MYDRKLLSKLSRCAWSVLSAYLKHVVQDDNATPGAAIAVQTFGEFQNFNPHLHAIVSNGCFSKGGDFHMTPRFILEDQTEIFPMTRPVSVILPGTLSAFDFLRLLLTKSISLSYKING